jgi:hypothetical protein
MFKVLQELRRSASAEDVKKHAKWRQGELFGIFKMLQELLPAATS